MFLQGKEKDVREHEQKSIVEHMSQSEIHKRYGKPE